MELLGLWPEVLVVRQRDPPTGFQAAEKRAQERTEIGDMVEDEVGGDQVVLLAGTAGAVRVCGEGGILGVLEELADGEDVFRGVGALQLRLEHVYHPFCRIDRHNFLDQRSNLRAQKARSTPDFQNIEV